MKPNDFEIMKGFFKSRNVGFSSQETSSYIGTTKGTDSILMKPTIHRNVEGSADYELEFVFRDGTLIGISIDPSPEREYLD